MTIYPAKNIFSNCLSRPGIPICLNTGSHTVHMQLQFLESWHIIFDAVRLHSFALFFSFLTPKQAIPTFLFAALLSFLTQWPADQCFDWLPLLHTEQPLCTATNNPWDVMHSPTIHLLGLTFDWPYSRWFLTGLYIVTVGKHINSMLSE
jgi:hypothetical protein